MRLKNYILSADIFAEIAQLSDKERLAAYDQILAYMASEVTPTAKSVVGVFAVLQQCRKKSVISQKRSISGASPCKSGKRRGRQTKAAKTAEKVAVSEFDVQALISLEKFRKYFNLFASKSGEYWQLDALTDIQSAQLNGLFKKYGEQTVFNECQKALNGQPSDIDFSFLKP